MGCVTLLEPNFLSMEELLLSTLIPVVLFNWKEKEDYPLAQTWLDTGDWCQLELIVPQKNK